jgi:hypothetical protein
MRRFGEQRAGLMDEHSLVDEEELAEEQRRVGDERLVAADVPEADAIEQRLSAAHDDADTGEEPPVSASILLHADPADVAEQCRGVPAEDEYGEP